MLILGGNRPASAAEIAPGVFKLADGDRVVLLGSTLIERDQAHGYLETSLSSRFYPARIQFRNLGWSGDNVFGEARAGFGNVAHGFDELKKQVERLQPTVILLNYGANESFAGSRGLKPFEEGLNALLATLGETKAQIAFIGPPRHEDLGRPLPDPKDHNRDLKLYSDFLIKVAAKRQVPYVSLFDLLGPKSFPAGDGPLTDNGIHLTAYGYWRIAPLVEQGLGLPARKWHIDVDARQQNVATRGTTVSDVRFTPGRISFRAHDEQLPMPLPPEDSPAGKLAAAGPRIVRVFELPPGNYALRIGGQTVAEATAAGWSAGVNLSAGPDFEQAEHLRQLILGKNLLYFHRWRPQNETYLFGFRKHEQGQNAVEIPQFDPLIESDEAKIHALCAPLPRDYEIVSLDSQ